ncbi:hypothetical protein NEOLEDRAFT_1182715 [Neolentinus lepideus HHB14362 ss-1]|uniref:F-box domain-containing protein n=1 Tax=Neolentinus lepideus HHB14362 ss-1 TaxID=1314782 RepID=A0A165NW48_9AGAM|nr:hypothetical protein NEOLEDRAFT_1182715 [Neolentinus lepideus HHB14362 ss-1]
MESPLPLLRLLGSAVTVRQNEFGYPAVPRDYALRPHITDEQWSRFDIYAERVRVLGSSNERMNPGVFERIFQMRGRPMFPNLQELTWSAESYSSVQGLPGFMTASLSRVCIRVGTSDATDAIHHLSHIQGDQPALKSLELEMTRLYSGQTLSKFHHIRDLKLGCPIAPEVFAIIAALHSLSELSINLEQIRDQDVPSPLAPRFPHLKTLKIRASMFVVVATIQSIASSTLHELIVELIPSSSLPRTRALCVAVSRFSLTLRTLSVRRHLWLGLAGSPYELRPRDIAPLLDLKELRSLTLQFSTNLTYWTSADLQNWSIAWPLLEEMCFILHAPSTFRSLVQLVSHFPFLRSLTWPDVKVYDSLEFEESKVFSPHPLVYLHVNFLLVEGPAASAEVGFALKELFPKLSRMSRINPPAIHRFLEGC